MQDYYYRPTSLWRKLRCRIRLIPLIVGLGHDFEIQYTAERRWEPHTDFRVGEEAYVCRLCFRVEGRRDYRVIPEVHYGSSPSMGRRLARRLVDHLPVAPDGQEPKCGARMPVSMYGGTGSATLVRCRKFAWHVRSDDRSMRTHSGSRPGLGGCQTFMWDDPEDVLVMIPGVGHELKSVVEGRQSGEEL